ncbi:MAG: hypothetical protein E6H07_07810 [Bacteroidetes bacterium]|nr:MAG: hypothetical protein E6H07_07810 [Bacteroidota bacterium]
MKQLITSLSLLLLLIITVQKKAFAQVKIGKQIWMAQNLNVSNFRNGDIIPEARSDEDWEKAGIEKRPAWCYYNEDAANGKKYGKLYNWYAVNDPRGLAPQGWHIPGQKEWLELDSYLASLDFQVAGIISYTGQRMKAISGWDNKGNGNNKSGFNALPGGNRFINGVFLHGGDQGWWWTSTAFDTPDQDDYDYGVEKGNYEDDIHSSWFFILKNTEDALFSKYTMNEYGFSVRCIKDPGISVAIKKVDNKQVTGKPTDTKGGARVPADVVFERSGPTVDGMQGVQWKDKLGFIDKDRRILIPFIYDVYAYEQGEGLIAIRKGGKYGYINLVGETVIPFQYALATKFQNGFASVIIDKQNPKYGMINKTGKMIIPAKFDYPILFVQSLIPVSFKGKYGFYDTLGRQVTEFIYESYTISEGKCSAVLNGKIVYIINKPMNNPAKLN